MFLKMGERSDFRISSFHKVVQVHAEFCSWMKNIFFKSSYVFWGRCPKITEWHLYGSLTVFQESYLDPCSTVEHQTCSTNQSQHDLLYGGVSLSISLNLKLAPVPYATPKWLIASNLLIFATLMLIMYVYFLHSDR